MEKKTYIKPQIRIVGCNELMTASFTGGSSNGSGALIKKSDNVYDNDGGTTISTSHGVSLWDDEADGLNE